MKCAILLVLFAISACQANNLVCQLFDVNSKSLEKYCGLFKGILPVNCAKDQNIDPSEVKQLKLNGCDSVIVSEAIKKYSNVRVLDISDSNYKTLDWLDLQLEYLQILNASHNEISNITKLLQHVPSINEVDLSHNKFQTLTWTSFGQLDTLTKLDLSHNLLEHINSDIFFASINLEFVDLSNNNFLSLPEFPHTGKLKTIHLEENTIKNFTCQRIPWMSSVSVHLSWTYVELFDGHDYCDGKQLRATWNSDNEGIFTSSDGNFELHYNAQSFRNLRYFRAGRNAFSNAIDILSSFGEQLSHLDLAGNFLGHLDINTFKKFVNLNELSLSDTKLVHFDFGMLQSDTTLKSLDISYNHLKRLNNIALLKNFVQLKELNVAGNDLQGISEITHYLNAGAELLDFSHNNIGILYNFERLTKLKTLILSNTNLTVTNMSNPFESLSNLHVLDISHNSNFGNMNFTTLSTTFIKLHHLNVAYCYINNIFDVIQYLGKSIKKLNIAGNLIINGLHSHTFETLHNLIYLNLSHTDLDHFDFETVHNQKWLYTLDISFNELHAINCHLLSKFSYLRRLHVEGNYLRKFDNFVPSATPNLSLGMAKNLFPCAYLKQLRHDSPKLRFIGNPLDQKHGDNCRSSIQAINDFLGTVYDTVKFW